MTLKEELITKLNENKGRTLSGKELAEGLGVTRSAVWKAVQELRAEGCEITAVTNRGYRLTENNDLLSAEQVQKRLTVPGEVRYVKETESTNLALKELALAGAPHGTVLIAERQTGGKGRLNRSFFSPENTGLYLSVLLRPQFADETIFRITAGAAVAVMRAAEKLGAEPLSVKWVNDVYRDGKKVCGILTEGSFNFENGAVDYIVVGIGVNVYEPEDGFPEELRGVAAAVFDDKRVSRAEFAAGIVNELLGAALNDSAVMREYRGKSCVVGKKIRVSGLNESYTALALDVTEQGYLKIRTESGEEKLLSTGEVSIRTE